jgi:hypothetical protein
MSRITSQGALYLIVLITFLIVHVFGQPGGGPGDPGGDADAVPLTGIEFLLAGGALLGIGRLFNLKRQKPQ